MPVRAMRSCFAHVLLALAALLIPGATAPVQELGLSLLQKNVVAIRAAKSAQAAKNSRSAASREVEQRTTQLQAQGPTTPPVPANAAEAAGVTGNGSADGAAFFVSLVVNGHGVLIFAGIFMFLRTRYPMVYSNNVNTGAAPTAQLGSTPDEVKENLNKTFGWITASLKTPTEEVAQKMGLDQAMLCEFANLAMRITKLIGIPMICIIGPINCAFGGQPAWRDGDYLSSLSYGNIENGSKLYWMQAFVVWYVVIVVQVNIYQAQRRFLALRYQWLQDLPEARASTVLVEGIPNDCRSDAKLKQFFTGVFGGKAIKSAYVVKNTAQLEDLVRRREASGRKLAEAKAVWAKSGGGEDKRPQNFLHGDSINYYEEEVTKLETQVVEERKQVQKQMLEIGGVNMYSGFVTFTEKRTAQLAMNQLYSEDREEWMLSIPPEPVDLIWSDLQEETTRQRGREFLGYAAIAGLYFAYMPIILGISKLAVSIDAGPLEPLWIAFAPTLGLQFMVCFLPTFILMIIEFFFTLKAEAWAQQMLQITYFWFQVVFVVLVTAIGGSVAEFTKTMLFDPLAIPRLLGTTMPPATHFYMNFLVLQWVSHAMNLTRYMELFKFRSFCVLYEAEEAKKMSEPESQDYYGIGARSARHMINLMIAIVYGTLCPPMNLLAWINFWISRVVYGYLQPFAETKKADTGGVFWVQCLKQCFIANIIYCVVMTGVLSGRANMTGFTPTFIAAPSLLYVIWSYRRFDKAFAWETLPITKVSNDEKPRRPMQGSYVQPLLFPSK